LPAERKADSQKLPLMINELGIGSHVRPSNIACDMPPTCCLQAGEEIDEAELEASACAMGYGAVKYADLRNSRLTNYKFSFDNMLDLKGNTAVYLLYAHARIAGIVRKSGRDIEALLAEGKAVSMEHPKERELAMTICKVGAQGAQGGRL
jgi:arginyl-tRNA synthetase